MRPRCFSFAFRLGAPAHAAGHPSPAPSRIAGRRAPALGAACHLIPLLGSRQRMLHLGAVLAWGGAVAYFWVWWLRPHHNIGTAWFIVNSVVLGWLTLVPFYLLCLYIRGRINALEAQPPAGRVAMVVTKAPSEPCHLLRAPLPPMLPPHHPHN